MKLNLLTLFLIITQVAISQRVTDLFQLTNVSDKVVNAVLVSENICWLGTEQGLYYGHLSDDKTKISKLQLVNKFEYAIAHLAEIPNSDIILAITYSGDLRSVANFEAKELLKLSQFFYQFPILGIGVTFDERIIISGENGILEITDKDTIWVSAPDKSRVKCVSEDKLGRLFIGTEHGFYQRTRFNSWNKLADGFCLKINSNSSVVKALIADKNGRLSLYSLTGLSEATVSQFNLSKFGFETYGLDFIVDKEQFTWLIGYGMVIHKSWESGYTTDKSLPFSFNQYGFENQNIRQVLNFHDSLDWILTDHGILFGLKKTLKPQDADVFLGVVLADKMLFRSNRSRLSQKSMDTKRTIALLAKKLMDNPSYIIQIDGFTGKTYKDYNNLSMRRAQELKKQLIKFGISEDRIYVFGKGRWSKELDPSSESSSNKAVVILIDY